MTDIAMHILIQAQNQASGAFALLKSAAADAQFGLRNLSTEGTIGMDALKSAGMKAGTAFAQIGVMAAAAAAEVVVSFSVKSVQAASDFQQAMNKNVALAGVSKNSIDSLSKSIMDMAVKVGKSPTELANALYPIYSAGFKGAEGLNLLDKASMSSASGMVDATVVSNAAASAFNAFNMRTGDAQTNITRMNGVIDTMNATVSAGNMQWSNYATKVGDLAAKASQSHIGFDEANAALATFTNTGESVDLAGTHLGALFMSMSINADTLAKHATKLGEDFDVTKFQSLDLAGKIKYLDDITGHDPGKVRAILGNQTLVATFEKLKDHTQDYQGTLKSLDSSQGATAKAFATTQQGFTQSMARAKAAIDVLMIKIGTALLPELTKLVNAVIPIIIKFADWLTKSGALQTAINVLVGVLTTLVNAGAAVYNFFANNQIASDALLAVLITLAIFIAAVIIPAFIAWAAAMIPVVIETLIVAAPYVLIGIVIAAVILGIILLIQHWGQITTWLSGVWQSFSAWFAGAMTATGNFFASVWSRMVSGVQAAWNFIVNIAKIGAAWLLSAIIGPFVAIGAAFVWLYNHNYYFKALIDSIVGFVKGGIAWLQGAWTTSVTFISAQWQRLAGFATSIWNGIASFIAKYITIAVNAVQTKWNQASAWLSAQWNKLSSMAASAWQAVSSVFASIWTTYIGGPMGDLYNRFTGWFSDMATQAWNSGINFINMLVNGITSGTGAIWNAVVGIANTIWKALGFHSPAKAGPGADADTWMPNLISMLSSGLKAGTPKMQSAVLAVAQPLTALNVTSTPMHATNTPSTTNSSASSAISIVVNAPGRSRNESNDIADAVIARITQLQRRSGTAPTLTSGGRAV